MPLPPPPTPEERDDDATTTTTTTTTTTPSLPTVLWAQRRDRIFLTFEIKNSIRDSIRVEVENPYPVSDAMEDGDVVGMAGEPYVGTSVVVFSCESLVYCEEDGDGRKEEGILMIDDCSVETVGEKLKRQAFGGEEEGEEDVGNEKVTKPRTPDSSLHSSGTTTTTTIEGERIETQPGVPRKSSPTSVVDHHSPLSRRRSKKQSHAIQLELYNAVLSTQISHKFTFTDKTIHLVLFKPKPTPHWPRLLATREKFRHVKTDFDSWKDEDEELEDENKFTFDANKMLKIDQYEDAELFDDISSDDEDMPDLTEMV
jgi:hypothetical protein